MSGAGLCCRCRSGLHCPSPWSCSAGVETCSCSALGSGTQTWRRSGRCSRSCSSAGRSCPATPPSSSPSVAPETETDCGAPDHAQTGGVALRSVHLLFSCVGGTSCLLCGFAESEWSRCCGSVLCGSPSAPSSGKRRSGFRRSRPQTPVPPGSCWGRRAACALSALSSGDWRSRRMARDAYHGPWCRRRPG